MHKTPPKKDIIQNILSLDDNVKKDIGQTVQYLLENQGKMDDSIVVFNPAAIGSFYTQHDFAGMWSKTGAAAPVADSLLQIINQADDYGLDPASFHRDLLDSLTRYVNRDSVARRDAAAWSQIDILLSDAFLKLVTRLHYGVIPHDSISLRKDTVFSDTVLVHLLNTALKDGNIAGALASVEPVYSQYHLLKQALLEYRERYAGRDWDTLPTGRTDSVVLQGLLRIRLLQSGAIDSAGLRSAAKVKEAVKAFQRSHGLYPDGVAGGRTIEALNISKADRIKQIALNLERWREMPDSLPQEYILVNIPSYSMQLWNEDTARLESRVIVGEPEKPTPLLNSSLINFQLYPYWRVPFSIVIKEMLPAIQKNIGYLASHNLEVIDRHNNPVDPATLNWKKFNKNYFPYLIRQMTGLDNSLGIMKFNFRNKYAVYLHDTNTRGLFGKSFRALSHGCVRVQQWDSLAMYLVRNDTLRHVRDSVISWIASQQQKQVNLSRRMPLYIRYFTCAVNDKGKLIFYHDVYGYDSLMEKEMAARQTRAN